MRSRLCATSPQSGSKQPTLLAQVGVCNTGLDIIKSSPLTRKRAYGAHLDQMVVHKSSPVSVGNKDVATGHVGGVELNDNPHCAPTGSTLVSGIVLEIP